MNLDAVEVFSDPTLREEYRTAWRDLWSRRGNLDAEMEDVRAIMLGFLIEKVPVQTAQMIANEYMEGLAK